MVRALPPGGGRTAKIELPFSRAAGRTIIVSDQDNTSQTKRPGAQACVAIGHAAGWTGVQDTTEHPDSRQRTTLAVPTQQFAAFITAVQHGHL